MHPIERLRYVARSSGADQELLVRETAGALAAFGWDPAGLVTACRRILDRHPEAGALWWLSARVLTAGDPGAEAWAATEELSADQTAVELAHALPEGATACVLGWPETVGEALTRRGDLEVLVVDARGEGAGLVRRLVAADVEAVDVPMTGLGAAAAAGDLVLLGASAIGPTGFAGVAGSRAAAAVARQAGIAVWVVAGIGRLLPGPMWDALVCRLDACGDAWENEDEVVPLDLVDRFAGPKGVETVEAGLGRTDCPIAPELLRFPA
ncbi:hypothetical protein BH18ACT4_BH18ACT4_04060 [soil metagenome]